MTNSIANFFLSRGEKQIGVKLDYARKIASVNFGLFLRYGKIFNFLDPNKHVPSVAYHTARLTGALSADCGACLEAEVNMAINSGMDKKWLSQILSGSFSDLPTEISAVAKLAEAVTNFRDDPEAREIIIQNYGESGLIELSYAMNGAVLLPGIKRAMGFATTCNLDVMQRISEK